MRYVQTINGPVPIWKWRLRWRIAAMLESIISLWCYVVGHRVIPELDVLYCGRCHKWNDQDGRGWSK